MNSSETYSRNDHEPGYIYLIEAEDTTGWIPGKLVKRCKIGLSRNPEFRRDNFVNSQFPCDVTIITTIFVDDMAASEAELHLLFKHCNLKLEKSREWFMLNLIDYYRCLWAFKSRKLIAFSVSEIPFTKIVKVILGFALVSTLGLAAYTYAPAPQSQENIEIKNLKR